MTFVYFIKPVGHAGPIKIGQTNNPQRRFSDLDKWAPWPLELLATINGDRDLERRFHHHFRHLHERREWFRVDNELQAVIAEVAAGSFDVSTLPEPRNVPRKKRSADYITPAWRYRRSVQCRLTAIIRKHDRHTEAAKLATYLNNYLGLGDPSRWLLHKNEIEREIARLERAA